MFLQSLDCDLDISETVKQIGFKAGGRIRGLFKLTELWLKKMRRCLLGKNAYLPACLLMYRSTDFSICPGSDLWTKFVTIHGLLIWHAEALEWRACAVLFHCNAGALSMRSLKRKAGHRVIENYDRGPISILCFDHSATKVLNFTIINRSFFNVRFRCNGDNYCI